MAARGMIAQGMMWEKVVLDAMAEGTWRSPAATAAERSKILNGRPSPLAVRADSWNTYCISASPYVCQIAPMP
eukprot:2646322-Lingulodinium_polyedra.AAC.1